VMPDRQTDRRPVRNRLVHSKQASTLRRQPLDCSRMPANPHHRSPNPLCLKEGKMPQPGGSNITSTTTGERTTRLRVVTQAV
jgi:hypothetical protein